MRAPTVYAVIAILTFGVFSTINTHDFVFYGDRAMIQANPHVLQGVGGEATAWAFEVANGYAWQPLAWLSLQASRDSYDLLDASPWLFTNLALHIAASLLLLLALSRLTGRLWPSAFVASVYALHPLQVETVAWASARSEALAGVCFAAALVAWAAWLEKPGAWRYALVVGAVVLGTLSGPGFAALPFVLLLLDVWPLGRVGLLGVRSGRFADRPAPAFGQLLLEKTPLLLIGLAGAFAQRASAAVMANPWSADPSIGERLALAPMNLVEAAARIIWPSQLSFTYPSGWQIGLGGPSAFEVWVATALMLTPLVVFARMSERARPLFVGWAWFLVLALPSAGLWPSGLRMLHDRDLQLALIGIAVALSFGGGSLLERTTKPALFGSLLAALVLVPLAATARVQTGVWRDSDTLFDHALAIDDRDSMALYYKGFLLVERGFDSAALHQLERAVEISPDLAHANLMLGAMYVDRANPGEAVGYLRRAAAGMPRSLDARIRLAEALAATGDPAAAFEVFDEAAAIDPASAQLQFARGNLYQAQGAVDEAIDAYRATLELDASHGVARARLGSLERARARAQETSTAHGDPGQASPAADEVDEQLAPGANEVDEQIAPGANGGAAPGEPRGGEHGPAH